MNKTLSSEDESPKLPVYEKPVLKEYGTLLELTLGATGKSEKTPTFGGTTGGGSL